MLLRGVILGIDHRIRNVWLNPKNNWFECDNRSYRIDREAVCQVVNKGGALRGIVELLYIEGNPIPIGSSLDVKTVTIEHLREKISKSVNKPKKKGLFERLAGS